MEGFIKRSGGWKHLAKECTPSEIETVARSAELWFMSAASLRNAARQIRPSVDQAVVKSAITSAIGANEPVELRSFMMSAPLLMLYGMAFESFLKARHIALNPSFNPVTERGKWWISHDLRDLAAKTNYSLKQYGNQELLLIEDMSAAIHLGRYPFHRTTERAGTGWDFLAGDIIEEIVQSASNEAFAVIDREIYAREAERERLAKNPPSEQGL